MRSRWNPQEIATSQEIDQLDDFFYLTIHCENSFFYLALFIRITIINMLDYGHYCGFCYVGLTKTGNLPSFWLIATFHANIHPMGTPGIMRKLASAKTKLKSKIDWMFVCFCVWLMITLSQIWGQHNCN